MNLNYAGSHHFFSKIKPASDFMKKTAPFP